MAGNDFSSWLQGIGDSNFSQAYTAQRGEEGYLRGTPQGLGASQVPAMWKAFAPFGESLINKEHLARYRGQATGLASGRREFERGLLNAYQSAGANPLMARAQLAESAPQLGEQLSALRGQNEAARLEDIFGFSTALQNAFAQNYDQERNMLLQAHLASLGRKSGREGAKSQMWGQLGGAALGAAGMAFGGPLGGMIAGGAGQQMFGGGQQAQPDYTGWGL